MGIVYNKHSFYNKFTKMQHILFFIYKMIQRSNNWYPK